MVEILGFLGAALILLAFHNVSTGYWQGTQIKYQFTNLMAGLLLLSYGLQKAAYANVALNIIFSLIAVFAIIKTGSHKFLVNKQKKTKKRR